MNVTQSGGQVPLNRLCVTPPFLGGELQSVRNQALSLCPAPSHDLAAFQGAGFDVVVNHVAAAGSLRRQ